MPVFHDEALFSSGADLGKGRHVATRKKIFGHEGFRRGRGRKPLADGMQKEKAVIGQAAPDNPHEIPVIFIAHVFEYAHGNNVVECPAYITIILKFEFSTGSRSFTSCGPLLQASRRFFLHRL